MFFSLFLNVSLSLNFFFNVNKSAKPTEQTEQTEKRTATKVMISKYKRTKVNRIRTFFGSATITMNNKKSQTHAF